MKQMSNKSLGSSQLNNRINYTVNYQYMKCKTTTKLMYNNVRFILYKRWLMAPSFKDPYGKYDNSEFITPKS